MAKINWGEIKVPAGPPRFNNVNEVVEAWKSKELTESHVIRILGEWEYRDEAGGFDIVSALADAGVLPDHMYDAILEVYAWEVERRD